MFVEGEVLRAEVTWKGKSISWGTAALRCRWVRVAAIDAAAAVIDARPVVGEGLEYTLGPADVRHFIQLECTYEGTSRTAAAVGPVLPGRPALRDISITGDAAVGSVLTATGVYFGVFAGGGGGGAGASAALGGTCDWWWMRVSPEGKRVEMAVTKAVVAGAGADRSVAASHEAITYRVVNDDVGCRFKVRCLPRRGDGAVGQTFTSKPTPKVVLELAAEETENAKRGAPTPPPRGKAAPTPPPRGKAAPTPPPRGKAAPTPPPRGVRDPAAAAPAPTRLSDAADDLSESSEDDDSLNGGGNDSTTSSTPASSAAASTDDVLAALAQLPPPVPRKSQKPRARAASDAARDARAHARAPAQLPPRPRSVSLPSAAQSRKKQAPPVPRRSRKPAPKIAPKIAPKPAVAAAAVRGEFGDDV
jgi:hypothetical protein